MPNGKKTTIYDIAKEARSSASTVASVLNGTWQKTHQEEHGRSDPENCRQESLQPEPSGARPAKVALGPGRHDHSAFGIPFF